MYEQEHEEADRAAYEAGADADAEAAALEQGNAEEAERDADGGEEE